MSVLITGFLPFLGEKINPSELLLKSAEGFKDVKTLRLPVSYKEAVRVLVSHLAANKYDTVLMLGQSGGRSKISLERVAVNWQESAYADETGFHPATGKISEGDPNAYFSTLPLEKIRDHLSKQDIPVEISFSAGAFVCNAVFYQAAHSLEGTKTRCGFIHVPYLPEQVVDKHDKPSMDLDTMEKGLHAIVECVL